MSAGSNIKGAPIAPEAVDAMIEWMDARHVVPTFAGIDFANGPDCHAEVLIVDGQIISLEGEV